VNFEPPRRRSAQSIFPPLCVPQRTLRLVLNCFQPPSTLRLFYCPPLAFTPPGCPLPICSARPSGVGAGNRCGCGGAGFQGAGDGEQGHYCAVRNTGGFCGVRGCNYCPFCLDNGYPCFTGQDSYGCHNRDWMCQRGTAGSEECHGTEDNHYVVCIAAGGWYYYLCRFVDNWVMKECNLHCVRDYVEGVEK